MSKLAAFALLLATVLRSSADTLTDAQSDFVGRLATPFASTEICDFDIDSDRVGALLQQQFGPTLTAQATSELMYRVVVQRGVHGVQMRGQSAVQKRQWCAAIKGMYGPNGTDLKGVLR